MTERQYPPDQPLRNIQVQLDDGTILDFAATAVAVNKETGVLEVLQVTAGLSSCVAAFAPGTWRIFTGEPYTREEVAECFRIREQQEEVEFANALRRERIAHERQERYVEQAVQQRLDAQQLERALASSAPTQKGN